MAFNILGTTNSAEVAIGGATRADEYNALRDDALTALGSMDSVALSIDRSIVTPFESQRVFDQGDHSAYMGFDMGGGSFQWKPYANRNFSVLTNAIQHDGVGTSSLGGGLDIGGDFSVPSGSKLFPDGGGDTYIHEKSGNTIGVVAGGVEAWQFTSAGRFYTGVNKNLSDPLWIVRDSNTNGIGAAINYILDNSNDAQRTYAKIFGTIVSNTAGSEDGKLQLATTSSGSSTTKAEIDEGLVVGSPTGGDKGTGTINAEAVYDDNSLLTDYVFEDDYDLVPIPEMRVFYQTHKHLPTIKGRDAWEKEGSFSLGELANMLWETVEAQARYIAHLDERLSSLEAVR